MITWNNEDYLMHYGIPLRSGRYPAGSGKNPKTGPRGISRRKRLERYENKKKVAESNIRQIGKVQKEYDRNPTKFAQKYYKGNPTNKQMQRDIDISRKINKRDVAKYTKKSDKLRDKIAEKSLKKGKDTPDYAVKKPTDKEKANIVTSTDAKKLLKYERYLSNNELKQGLERINTKKKLKAIAAQDRERGLKTFEKWANRADNVATSATKAYGAYKKFANLYNSFSGNKPPKKHPAVNNDSPDIKDGKRYKVNPKNKNDTLGNLERKFTALSKKYARKNSTFRGRTRAPKRHYK